MRASIHGESDCRDYPIEDIFYTEIFLDGVKQDLCTVADEEGGYVLLYDEAQRDGCVKKVTGRVEIRLPVDSRKWTGLYGS